MAAGSSCTLGRRTETGLSLVGAGTSKTTSAADEDEKEDEKEDDENDEDEDKEEDEDLVSSASPRALSAAYGRGWTQSL